MKDNQKYIEFFSKIYPEFKKDLNFWKLFVEKFSEYDLIDFMYGAQNLKSAVDYFERKLKK